MNRLRLLFVLFGIFLVSSFHLLLCLPSGSFVCCASFACIVYISLNSYLFAFYFYVRKQREICLGFVIFFSFFLLLFRLPLTLPSPWCFFLFLLYSSVAFCQCFLWGVENHFVKQTCSCSFSTQLFLSLLLYRYCWRWSRERRF